MLCLIFFFHVYLLLIHISLPSICLFVCTWVSVRYDGSMDGSSSKKPKTLPEHLWTRGFKARFVLSSGYIVEELQSLMTRRTTWTTFLRSIEQVDLQWTAETENPERNVYQQENQEFTVELQAEKDKCKTVQEQLERTSMSLHEINMRSNRCHRCETACWQHSA